MLDDRTTLIRTCAAAAFAALVAGAVTYIPAMSATPDAVMFETPTSHLKGDRLDIKRNPLRSQPRLNCSKSNWPYDPDACLPARTHDVRFVSNDGDPAR